MINSALVSAQNRVRYYWTNIPGIEQPEQRGIVLRDILETNPDSNLDKMTNKQGKSYALTASYNGAVAWNSLQRKQRTMIPTDKPNKIHDIPRDILKDNERQRRVYGENGKSPTLLARSDSPKVMKTETITVDKEKKQLTIKEATKKGYTTIEDGDCFDMTFPNSKTRRGRNMKDKSNCLTATNYDYMRYEYSDKDKEVYWRKLTPVECERLQTVPDNYTNHVSNTQRYKMLGNGWTIEVICHILKKIKDDI